MTKTHARGGTSRRKTGGRSNGVTARPLHHGRHERTDDGNAFIPDPEGGPARTSDDLAENMAEEFLESATRGNDAYEDALDEVVPEEIGGPFIETSAADEFAHDIDETNPEDAVREPLPRPVAGLIDTSDDEEER
jgi:hypothetical protein